MGFMVNGKTPAQWRQQQATEGIASSTIPQRPFAAETMYSTSPWAPKVTRGFLQVYNTQTFNAEGEKLNFLYNPNQFTVSYAIQDDAIPITSQDPVGNGGGVGGPTQIAVSFQLLFNRSFEVAYYHDQEGVRHDIDCLEHMLQVSAMSPYLTKTIVLKMVLGANLTFFAYVTALNITYAYFNQDMVPMQASVDITANIQPVSFSTQENLQSQATKDASDPPNRQLRAGAW